MSRRSRSSSSARGRADAGPRDDGKVDICCPQCGARYRVAPDTLETKIECSDCHRVFYGKNTVGKRIAPDNTKAYFGFGAAAVILIGVFIAMASSGDKKAKPTAPPTAKAPTYSLGDHPRTHQLVKWARAIATDNRLVQKTHSDLTAVGKQLNIIGVTDPVTVMKELQSHESTRYLRELQCESGMLVTQADMTGATGRGIVYLTPRPGDDTYLNKVRGEIVVEFRMEGEQVRVTGWMTTTKPERNPKKPAK